MEMERRQYFRIDTLVGVKLTSIDHYSELNSAYDAEYGVPPSLFLFNENQALRQELLSECQKLSSATTGITKCIKIMSRRLDLVSKTLQLIDRSYPILDWQEVSMSEGGVSILYARPLKIDQKIHITIGLPDPNADRRLACPQAERWVCCFATVARCVPEISGLYHIGLNFEMVPEQDNQILAQFILYIQSAHLRREREKYSV
ncbi:MAG: PilZ domain-containing protein [Pseudomonadota bacterium]